MLKYMLEIIKMYLYLLMFVCLVSTLLKAHVIINYMLLLLMLWLIYVDESMNGWRYYMFVFMVMCHVMMLKEGWYQTEMLMMKDLFWYSLLMLGSFMWHVLMLNWLYKMCEVVKWDYGCYVMSRWSLLTSLTGMLWMLQWIQMMLDYYVKDYMGNWHGFSMSISCKEGLAKVNWMSKVGFKYNFLNLMLVKVFMVMVEYFCMMFQNYSKFLLGLNNKMNMKEIPKWFYIYFMLTFMLSWLLMAPRIYMMWVMLLLWNMSMILKSVIWELLWKFNNKNPNYIDERSFSLINFLFYQIDEFLFEKRNKYSFVKGLNAYKAEFVDFESFSDSWTDDWKLLYNPGLTSDYYWYSSLPNWHNSEYMRGVYEVFYVFEYSQERYKNLIIRMFKSYWAVELYSEYMSLSMDYYIECFKEDFSFINEDWLTEKYLLKGIIGDDEKLTFEIIEKWEDSFVILLKRDEWSKQGFMMLFNQKEKKIVFMA